ncbi:hypothetical protein ABZ464_51620 [Streptomyces sp. NPDC005820]|uniref:hypothetical protein n=1 Tax=Streptomyces sp. NPDC005820 TaxID=3157069 RepID=UPI0033FA0414
MIGDPAAGTPVAVEAAFGRGWLIELLQDHGFDAHMAHPLQCKAIASARKEKADPRAKALRTLPGVGPLAAVPSVLRRPGAHRTAP